MNMAYGTPPDQGTGWPSRWPAKARLGRRHGEAWPRAAGHCLRPLHHHVGLLPPAPAGAHRQPGRPDPSTRCRLARLGRKVRCPPSRRWPCWIRELDQVSDHLQESLTWPTGRTHRQLQSAVSGSASAPAARREQLCPGPGRPGQFQAAQRRLRPRRRRCGAVPLCRAGTDVAGRGDLTVPLRWRGAGGPLRAALAGRGRAADGAVALPGSASRNGGRRGCGSPSAPVSAPARDDPRGADSPGRQRRCIRPSVPARTHPSHRGGIGSERLPAATPLMTRPSPRGRGPCVQVGGLPHRRDTAGQTVARRAGD